jgi:outer membrane protein TolC
MLAEHLETARRKLASGTATELDVLNTQSRLVTAQNQRLELENGLEKESIALKRLLGRLDGEPLVLAGGWPHAAVAPDPEERVAAALQRRLEARAVRGLQRTNDIQFQLVASRAGPVISLGAVAGFKNDYFPHLDSPVLNFVLALQAHVPVFDGRLVRYQKAEVAANARGLDHRGQEIASLIRADVLQAIADVRASEEALRLVAVHIEQSQKALAFAKARYEAGSVTHLDLIDAIEACSMTRLIELQALYKCVASALNLRRACGDEIVAME